MKLLSQAFDFVLCASFLFALATTPKKTSAKHPKIHQNDPNTKRLAPTGKFLNVTITVNKSSYILLKLKRKNKKLILWTLPSAFFSPWKHPVLQHPVHFQLQFHQLQGCGFVIWKDMATWKRHLSQAMSGIKKAQLLCGSPKLKLLVHTLRMH